MKKVLKITEKSKRVTKAKASQMKSLEEYEAMELGSKVALIQELISLGFRGSPGGGKESGWREVRAQWPS